MSEIASASASVAAPAAGPAPPAAPIAPPAPPAWHDALAPEIKQLSASKSYDMSDPAKAFGQLGSSYANLEKMYGADRAGHTVILPADMSDQAAMGEVYKRLGRPDVPTGYEIKAPDGGDGKFAEKAATWFHEQGLSKAQANGLVGKWNEHIASEMTAKTAADNAALMAEHQALQRDWGTGDASAVQRENARRGAEKVGLDAAAIDALEKVSGYSKTMKALAKIGAMLGESGTQGLGETSSFGMTPEAARGRKTSLMADKDWRTRAMSKNSAEWAEIKRLDEIISREPQRA